MSYGGEAAQLRRSLEEAWSRIHEHTISLRLSQLRPRIRLLDNSCVQFRLSKVASTLCKLLRPSVQFCTVQAKNKLLSVQQGLYSVVVTLPCLAEILPVIAPFFLPCHPRHLQQSLKHWYVLNVTPLYFQLTISWRQNPIRDGSLFCLLLWVCVCGGGGGGGGGYIVTNFSCYCKFSQFSAAFCCWKWSAGVLHKCCFILALYFSSKRPQIQSSNYFCYFFLKGYFIDVSTHRNWNNIRRNCLLTPRHCGFVKSSSKMPDWESTPGLASRLERSLVTLLYHTEYNWNSYVHQ